MKTDEARVWTDPERAYIRRTAAQGLTDAELDEFLLVAERRRLDPLLGHIRAQKYTNRRTQEVSISYQTTIDGLRSLADRTGCYGGGPAPVFEAVEFQGQKDLRCTAAVRKLAGGAWHLVEATVYFREYAETRERDGKIVFWGMWGTAPHVMVAKVAEAAALRRAFPELGQLYISDEMGRAEQDAVDRQDAEEASFGIKGKKIEHVDETQYSEPPPRERENKAETPAFAADEYQRKRFTMALKHDPKLADTTKATFVARASAVTSGAAWDALCLELEQLVGLAEKAPVEAEGGGDDDDLPF